MGRATDTGAHAQILGELHADPESQNDGKGRYNMKTTGKHVVMAGIARQSLVLAALLAMVVSAANTGNAQSSATSAAAPAANPAAAPAKAPASPAAKPPAKGQHEGIKVHGHWVLEVRNPDGSVAKHVEFENNLVTPTNYPTYGMNGSQALVALLSGTASLGAAYGTTSPFNINLASLNSGDVSPCGQGSLLLTVSGVPLGLPNSCQITATSTTPPANLNTVLTNWSGGQGTSSLPTQLIISGTTAAAGQQGTIDSVATLIILTSTSPFTPYAWFPLTIASLPAQGSGTCGGTGQPPCAVSVGVGQTVMATVTISFQ
jgi:hypothetical protein